MRNLIFNLCDEKIKYWLLDNSIEGHISVLNEYRISQLGVGSFEILNEGDLIFNSFHKKLNMAIPQNFKIKYLEDLSLHLSKLIQYDRTDKSIIIIPNLFPEWAASVILNKLAVMKIINVVLVRSLFLQVIQKYLRYFISEKELQNIDFPKSEINYDNGVFSIIKIIENDFDIKSIDKLIRLFYKYYTEEFHFRCPFSLGFYNHQNMWIRLIDFDEDIPIEKYCYLQLEKQDTSFIFILYADLVDSTRIEILREIFEIDIVASYNEIIMKLNFTNSWFGKIEFKIGGLVQVCRPINPPFLIYNI